MKGMRGGLQGSLLDFADEIAVGPLGDSVRRTELTRGAWVDLRPQWVTGADELFARLVDRLPWRAEQRRMYERTIDVPRLLCTFRDGEPLPDPALDTARDRLNQHYGGRPGERFGDVGLCLYRDGRDSVAWHGDRIARDRPTMHTMVAILSLGAPRIFALRPRGGGAAQRREVGHGDLLVLGGTCQHTWEHAVPKTARPIGPRISIQFRTWAAG
jgi:alkylated DNA repair dioxygenase AlkB